MSQEHDPQKIWFNQDKTGAEQDLGYVVGGVLPEPTFRCFDPSFGFGSGSVPVNPLLSSRFPYQEELTFSNPPSSPPSKRFIRDLINPFSHFRILIIEQLFNAAELIGNNNNNGDHTARARDIGAAQSPSQLQQQQQQQEPSVSESGFSHNRSSLSLINNASPPLISPENMILRIAAYRTFSETSPFLQFVNFTANQSILESCNDELGFDRIHIIDFDVGYGGQWSSLMQELASRRRNRASSLKITVFAPPPSTVSDEFELRFTEENLRSFAGEVKIPFEIELLSLELLLNPAYWPVSPFVGERSCCGHGDESVERFWVQPSIEKLLMKRHRWIERSPPWRSLFTQCGFLRRV
ncbi:hypothetical protein Bca52824_007559 [Brassica carinata]|uniref:Uncharacterized protein n=1 Tax=Brassica carinata TaxID=52824 RepID=A0A8X7W7A4_BRACI|nr:hypothetical protein Bca52824_007559 [Brassica carinata]